MLFKWAGWSPRLLITVLLTAAFAVCGGCASSKGPQWSQRDGRQDADGDQITSAVAFPSGERDTSVLLVKRTARVRCGSASRSPTR